MREPKAPAAQAQHVGAMTKALEKLEHDRATTPTFTGTFGQSAVNSLVEALDRLMESHVQEAVRSRPRWMRDKDIIREYFGNCSRTHYWLITKQPGFPPAREISPRVRVRDRFEVEKWLAARPEGA
jgi:hypothetical protein